jgi:hypothetical protein
MAVDNGLPLALLYISCVVAVSSCRADEVPPPPCEAVSDTPSRGLRSFYWKQWPVKNHYDEPYSEEFEGRDGNLYVDIRPTHSKSGRPITVTLSLKTRGPYQIVCQSIIDRQLQSLRGKILVARRPDSDGIGATWKVEIDIPKERNSGPNQFTIDLYQDRASASADGPTKFYDRYFCASPTRSAAAPLAKPKVEFAEKSILMVSMRDRDNVLPPGGVQGIAEAITKAVAGWNAICFGCAVGNNAVVIVFGPQDPRVIYSYVQSDLYFGLDELLRKSLVPVMTTAPHIPASTWNDLALKSNSRSPGGGQSYVPVKYNPEVYRVLCLAPYEDLPPSLRAVRSVTCRERPGEARATNDMVYSVDLDVLSTVTSCPPADGSVIACTVPSTAINDHIELDAKHFAFRLSEGTGKSGVVFGSGTQNVDLTRVLLHEMGHWLGLPDMAGEASIMNNRSADAQCIDDKVVDAVQQALISGSANQTGAMFPLLYKK